MKPTPQELAEKEYPINDRNGNFSQRNHYARTAFLKGFQAREAMEEEKQYSRKDLLFFSDHVLREAPQDIFADDKSSLAEINKMIDDYFSPDEQITSEQSNKELYKILTEIANRPEPTDYAKVAVLPEQVAYCICEGNYVVRVFLFEENAKNYLQLEGHPAQYIKPFYLTDRAAYQYTAEDMCNAMEWIALRYRKQNKGESWYLRQGTSRVVDTPSNYPIYATTADLLSIWGGVRESSI